MQSTLVALADALTATLAGMPELAGAVISRTYVPRVNLEAMGDQLYVTVLIAAATNSQRLDRGSYRREPVIDIGLQKRTADDAQADEMVLLLDQVADYVWRQQPDGKSPVTVNIEELWVPEHLDVERVFTGVLRATYREGRSLV